MAAALRFARYDHRFELGTGGHDLAHGGAIFPDTLRWLWRDYPGVRGADKLSDPNLVTGHWEVTTHVMGTPKRSTLIVTEEKGVIAATLVDDEAGELEVRSISFVDGILSYEYQPAASQMAWNKGVVVPVATWLQVRGNRFEGALSAGLDSEADLRVEGQRRAEPD